MAANLSSATTDQTAPETPSPGLAEALRRLLGEANFTIEGVRELLHAESELSSAPDRVAIYERRLKPGDDLSTLARLFLLGGTASQADAERALRRAGLAALEESRILDVTERGVRALVRIVPHGELLIGCDLNHEVEGPGDPRVVTGINGPAILLAALTIRRRAGHALDVGTGNGIQSLLAAKHSERVTGLDINPRAIAFARFNAALNGIGNVQFEVGDLFAPVSGHRFDLIVCNPPYVISPESSFVYRDSGEQRDSLCRRITGLIPDYLNEGGYGQLLVSWVKEPDEDAAAAVRPWVEGRGCDAWLLHYRTEDPLTHAAKWNQPFSASAAAAFAQNVDAWLDYYRREGIQEIAFGAISLRRRQGPPANWTVTGELRSADGSASDQAQRVFDAQDVLRQSDGDEAFLALRLRLAPEHRQDQVLKVHDGRWQLAEATLRLEQGVGFTGTLDERTAAILARLDGSRPLRESLGPEDLELGLQVARRLFELGFLERLA